MNIRVGRSNITYLGVYLTAVVVLMVGFLLTLLVWYAASGDDYRHRQVAFEDTITQATESIQASFASYTALVRDGQALLTSAGEVSRLQWRAFGQSLDIGHRYAGVQSLTYIAYVPHAQLGSFLVKMRADHAPGYHILQAGERSFYCPIAYAEPENLASRLGMDACTTSKGLPLLLRARDQGQALLSAPLGLIDAQGKPTQGMVIAGPVYRMTMPSGSVIERRAALQGWVAVTVPLHVIMAGVVPDGAPLALVVYDGVANPGATPIYSWMVPGLGPAAERHPGRKVPVGIDLDGRRWTLVFTDHSLPSRAPLWIAVGGWVISLLMFLLVVNLGRTRQRALALSKEMTVALRENEQLLSSVTNNITDGIYRSKAAKGLIYVNDALVSMFGYGSMEEICGVPGENLYADPRRREELAQLLERQSYYRNEEVEYRRKDGSRFIGSNSSVAIKDEHGQSLYYDGVISDITERKLAEQQVYHLAHYDMLTGLPNRALFRDRLGQAIADAQRRGERLAVVFLDLDRFKNVNDSLGHDVGDQLLQAVAQRLVGSLRQNDSVSRQGGDEFILILRDAGDSELIAHVAEKIRTDIARPYSIDRHEINITPSIGISLYPDDGMHSDILIRNADTAMYQAKENGRFDYQFFTAEMNRLAHERLSLENHLRLAMERKEFTLEYQPEVSLRDGRIIGVEALLRWHSVEGNILPGTFIPIAEQSGLIVPIGEWVLRTACQQARAWQQAGLPLVPIAVNLSAIQFSRHNMDSTIAAILSETGLEASLLELELTESAVMQENRETNAMLYRLEAMGVRLAIDDFGTGYSSLSYLKRFRIDKIEIDRSFVRDITTDPDDAAIASAIISLARDLKVEVVAEGVETREQLLFLRRHACDGMQGYYFSRSVPADEFALMLREGRRLPMEA